MISINPRKNFFAVPAVYNRRNGMKVDKFFEEIHCAPSTRKTYASYLEYIDCWLIKNNVEIAKLAKGDFERFCKSRERWSQNTKRLALSAVRKYCRHFYGKDHPILEYTIDKADPPPQKTLTIQEVEKLIAVCDKSKLVHRQYITMILVFVDTWIRATELCHLEVKWLDLQGSKLSALTKGSRWKDKAFTDTTKSWLELWINQDRPKVANPDSKTIFCNSRTGQPFTRHGLLCIFRKLARKAGFDTSLHACRRGGSTAAAARGMPDRLGMLQGGWEDHSQYRHYTQTLPVELVKPYLATNRIKGADVPAPTPKGGIAE